MPSENLQIVFFQKNSDPAGTPETAGVIWVNRKTGGTWVSREITKADGMLELEWHEKTSVRSDWNETDPNSLAFIFNKPDIPEEMTSQMLIELLKNPAVEIAIKNISREEFDQHAPLTTFDELVQGTDENRKTLTPKIYNRATTQLARNAVVVHGVDDLFKEAPEGDPNLNDILIADHVERNRKVLRDRHDLTDDEGDTLGNLAKGNIALLVLPPQEIFYAVTDGVDNFVLGDDDTDDLFTVPNPRPERILIANSFVAGPVPAVLAVRRRTSTSPGFITLIVARDVHPIFLNVITNPSSGQRLKSTSNYEENLGWINGNPVGGYVFENPDVVEGRDFVADQLAFTNALFGPADNPKQVSDIHLNLVPSSGTTGGVEHPQVILALANVSEEVTGRKKFPLNSLQSLMVDAVRQGLLPELEALRNQVTAIELRLDADETIINEVNGWTNVAPSFYRFLGTTRNAYRNAANTDTFTFNVEFTVPASRAARLNANESTNTAMEIEGQSAFANPVKNSYSAGENRATFAFSKLTLEQIRNNSLDSNESGILDIRIQQFNGTSSSDFVEELDRVDIVII